jgi:general bacterial porin, GBP family
MKKLLIASAALAMVAGTAQAQSSVTVYGVIDQGFVNTKTTASGVSTDVTTQPSGNNATSIIGFKGTEDLGGGLKAIFDLQADLGLGNVGANNTAANSDTFFNRQAWVGLESAKLGTLRIGRISDVLDSTEGFANFTQVFDTEAAAANGLGGKNGSSTRYDSPVIAGLQVSASYSADMVAAAELASASAGESAGDLANSGTTGTTYGVVYKTGALTLGASAGKANVATSTLDGKLSTYYAGYNLGVADVRVQYTDNKAIDKSSNTNFTQTKTSEISASIPLAMLGSGVAAILHYESADVSNQAGAKANSDYKQYGVVLTKALSKRTTLYTAYKTKDVDGTGSDVDTFGLGVTHAF